MSNMYALIRHSLPPQVETGEVDLSTYYQEHLERFRKPEQMRLGYVVVDPESFVAQSR